jgi:hypothetical protein
MQFCYIYRNNSYGELFNNGSVAEPEPRSRKKLPSRIRNYETRLRLLSIYHRLEEILWKKPWCWRSFCKLLPRTLLILLFKSKKVIFKVTYKTIWSQSWSRAKKILFDSATLIQAYRYSTQYISGSGVIFKKCLRNIKFWFKGTWREADFLGFLHKPVRHRFLTLRFEPCRFWLRIRGDIRNRKTTSRLAESVSRQDCI